MIVSIIAAMDKNRGIGIQGNLPWHLPSDLKHFKNLTVSHHIILGRKTFESIGKPLPNRSNIILTRNTNFNPNGCLIAHTLENAINLAREGGEEEVFICGGGEIYSQAINMADKLYLTIVDTEIKADTFFPNYSQIKCSEQSSIYFSADEQNKFPFHIKIFIKM